MLIQQWRLPAFDKASRVCISKRLASFPRQLLRMYAHIVRRGLYELEQQCRDDVYGCTITQPTCRSAENSLAIIGPLT